VYVALVEPREILTQPRWTALARFVERWYAEPLGGAGAGASLEEIRRTEERLGRALPTAVREWYALVGHRFCDVNQDHAQRLDQLKMDGDRLPIWWENQGNWSFDVELDTDDEEPWVSVLADVEPDWFRRGRLADALLGMVYSDTLVGVWSGHGVGPLGPLAANVVGGCRDDPPSGLDDRVASLPALSVMTNPYFAEALRGHEALVIRGSSMWEWMAATEDAHAEATTILQLEAPGTPRFLVVAIERVPPDARDAVRALVAPHFQRMDSGKIRSARYSSNLSAVVLEIEATDPEAALAELRSCLPASVVEAMRAGHRSPHTMRFVPCWPIGLASFTQPRIVQSVLVFE
jgi:hypothetical protein